MPITISITGRSGTISDFIGGLCSEKLIFIGESLTLPAKVALIDLDGTTLAAADLQSDDTGAVFANLSTDTQQVADRYRYQPPDTLNRATLFVGDDTTLQAVIEVQVKKNWLDDTAYHPPVAPNIYPTEAELETWLAQAKKIGEQIQEVSGPALESAKKAEQAATRASQYASDAAGSSISAAKSYENAEASRAGAESAAQVARDASENAQLQQQQAAAAAGKANGYRQQAANSQRLAERAQEKAEAAQQAAEEAQSAADGFASDAAQSAQEAAAKADEASQAAADAGSASNSAQSAKTAAETAKTQAEAAKTAAQAAKTSAEKAKQDAEAAKTNAETAAGNAATSASNAAESATKAEEAKADIQANADRIGYGFVAPGSPLVIVGGESTCFTLVKLVDDMVEAGVAPCLISRIQEGDYWFAMAFTKNAEKNAYHCYILGDDLKPRWEFWHPRGHGRILPYCVIAGGSAYIRTENTFDRFTLTDDGTGTLVKSINLPLRGYYQGICQPQIAYNPKSGHILVADGGTYNIDVWRICDLELNKLGETASIGPGTWFTLNGWSYFVNNKTLYRALADDTLEEVVASDGTHLQWNTKVDGINTATWAKPGIFYFNGMLRLHDGVRSFVLSYGDEGEIVLGPKNIEDAHTAVTNCSGAIMGKSGFAVVTSTVYPQIRINSNREGLSNGYHPAIFQGAHYNTYRDVRPMLFVDTANRTFDAMFNGAVMIQKYPNSYGG